MNGRHGERDGHKRDEDNSSQQWFHQMFTGMSVPHGYENNTPWGQHNDGDMQWSANNSVNSSLYLNDQISRSSNITHGYFTPYANNEQVVDPPLPQHPPPPPPPPPLPVSPPPNNIFNLHRQNTTSSKTISDNIGNQTLISQHWNSAPTNSFTASHKQKTQSNFNSLHSTQQERGLKLVKNTTFTLSESTQPVEHISSTPLETSSASINVASAMSELSSLSQRWNSSSDDYTKTQSTKSDESKEVKSKKNKRARKRANTRKRKREREQLHQIPFSYKDISDTEATGRIDSKESTMPRERQDTQPVPHMHQEEMDISEEEEEDNKVQMITNKKSKMENDNICMEEKISSDTFQENVDSDSRKPNQTLRVESLEEKRARLSIALKKAAMERAKARLRQAKMKKEEARSRREQTLSRVSTKEQSVRMKARESAPSFIQNSTTAKRKVKLPNITAFRMSSLLISNINTSGNADLIRLRPMSSLAKNLSHFSKSISTNKVTDIHSSIHDAKQTSEGGNKMKEHELKLHLLKLKRKLLLKTQAMKASSKKQVEIDKSTYEESNDHKKNLSIKQINGLENDEVSKIDRLISQENVVSRREAIISELRQRQILLKKSIDSTKETNRELQYQKEVSELNELVKKQKRMLQWHGQKICESSESLRICNAQLESEKMLVIQSETRLGDLLKRKRVTENMVLSVSNKLIDSRRKRR